MFLCEGSFADELETCLHMDLSSADWSARECAMIITADGNREGTSSKLPVDGGLVPLRQTALRQIPLSVSCRSSKRAPLGSTSCLHEGKHFFCTAVPSSAVYDVQTPAPNDWCMGGADSWGRCTGGKFLCSRRPPDCRHLAEHGLPLNHQEGCAIGEWVFECRTHTVCEADCQRPNPQHFGWALFRDALCPQRNELCRKTKCIQALQEDKVHADHACLPSVDAVVNHRCIGAQCLLEDLVWDSNWTSGLCSPHPEPSRLCFGCYATIGEAGWKCTLPDAAPILRVGGQGPRSRIEFDRGSKDRGDSRSNLTSGNARAPSGGAPDLSPRPPPEFVLPSACSSLAQMKQGGETEIIGIPALVQWPGSCHKHVSGLAVLLYFDGWNPFHQVLQTFRRLFLAFVSFSVVIDTDAAPGTYLEAARHIALHDTRGRRHSGMPRKQARFEPHECVVVLSGSNRATDIGPFGRQVLSAMCSGGILEPTRSQKRICFSQLLLGASPGGWDMEVSGDVPAAVDFTGIFMASWIKKSLGASSMLSTISSPKESTQNAIVSLVVRHGPRSILNMRSVVRAMTCPVKISPDDPRHAARAIGPRGGGDRNPNLSHAEPCSYSLFTVDLDKTTLRESVDLMSRSRVLVGVHGAGLTNLIFLPPRGAVVELRVDGRREFEQLCRSFAKQHFSFFETKLLPPTSDTPGMREGDVRDMCIYVIRPRKLAAMIREVVNLTLSSPFVAEDQ